MNNRTVHLGGTGEIEEKKSRFIATVCAVNSEEEAVSQIAALRKQYYDARHNCYAYIIGENEELVRSSDDGEPSGTAGRPILEVIKGEHLVNTLVVVTRYFGGTLLGTGGLVRAYTAAAKAGIANSITIEKLPGIRLNIGTDYEKLGKIQYLIAELNIITLNTDYTDTVTFDIIVPTEIFDKFQSSLMDATLGKCTVSNLGDCLYCDIPGEGIRIYD